MRSAVRRLCGQSSCGPNRVSAQSRVAIRVAMLPPAVTKAEATPVYACGKGRSFDAELCFAGRRREIAQSQTFREFHGLLSGGVAIWRGAQYLADAWGKSTCGNIVSPLFQLTALVRKSSAPASRCS